MDDNSTAYFDKLSCTSYVDIGNCQDGFGQLSWFKDHSNYLDVEFRVFKKDDNKKFRLVQNLTTGEAVSNQFMWLRNQPVIQAENFAREEHG